MTIKEVYKKYKHLDDFLSNKDLLTGSGFRMYVLYQLWQVIKEKCEKK